MALKWFQTVDLVDRDVSRFRTKAQAGLDWMREQEEARARAEEEREEAEREKRASLVQRLTAQRQQTTAIEQLETAGIWPELITGREREAAIQTQVQSGFRWAEEIMKQRRSERAMEQAGEWEKEKEAKQKERSKVISQLMKQGLITYEMTPEEAEPLIQQALYEARAKTALEGEDWEKAKEYQREADWWMQYLYGEPEAKAKVKPEVKPGVAPEMRKPEKAVRAIGKGITTAAGGIYRATAGQWSALINMADLLVRKDESEWSAEEAEFMKEIKASAEATKALNMLKEGGREIHLPMAHLATESPKLWEAYDKLSMARKMAGEMTYPGWFLLPAGATATGARTGLAGLSARLATTGVKVDKALIPLLQGTRAILWPPAQLEAGLAWILRLGPRAMSAAMARIQARRLATKVKEVPAKVADDIAPILEKIKTGEAFTTDDAVRAAKFDKKLGETVEGMVAKVEVEEAEARSFTRSMLWQERLDGIRGKADDLINKLEELKNLRVAGEKGLDKEIAALGKRLIAEEKRIKPIIEKWSAKFEEATIPKAEAIISPKLVEATAAKPDGGRAWELYTKLFDVEDATTTIRRLYPGGLEKRLAEVVGKAPLVGKGIVRRVNPFVTPRETIEAQKVQELLAVAADRRIRRSQGIKAVVEDLVRSVIPDADSIKLFGIDEKGIQHAFKAKAGFEKAPNGIVDVLEHPQKWQLNEPALKVSQIWNNIRESAVKELERRGIHVNKKFYEEGAGYFPRMVTGGRGEELRFPRVRFDRPRHYATQLEAMDNSITYTRDPIENMLGFIDHFHNLIAYDDLTKAVKLVGRTPKDAIPLTTIIAREQVAKELRGLTHAQNALRRMKRGERLPEITLKTIERNAEAFGKRTRDAMALAGEERVNAVSKLLGDLKVAIPKTRLSSLKAKADYKKALGMARSPRLGEFERGTKHPVFRGRIFPEEVARVLDEFAETGTSGFMRATQSVAQTLRTLVAALDFSPMFIQGTPMLGRFPRKWAMTTLRAFKAMASPSYAHKWMAKAENVAIRTRHPDLVSGGLHEYYAGMAGIRRLPVIGKPLHKIYEPFEQFFSFWGNAARLEIAKGLEPAFVKAGKVDQLATYVNRMTGVMETRALGISSTQRAAETSWVFFAPRYTRSCMAYIGDLFAGGIVGKEAWRTLGGLAVGGMGTYQAMCRATGQEPKIDPRYPTFMTLKVGNRHIGIGGFYYSFLRFIADASASIGGVGGAEIADFKKISRKDNPFIKFLYNRTSPLTGLVTEALQEKDYLGYPFEDLGDWAHWLFVEHMMPIALQEQFPERYTEAPTEREALLAAEMAGLRTFPVEPFYDLADKYAQQVFGEKWNELWQPTKAGTYRMSAKQKLLLKRFPDLAKAYEPFHEKQSMRWKAQHGLMPDKDIALDGFAQERFRKDFDELTDTQKRLVRMLYDRAKE